VWWLYLYLYFVIPWQFVALSLNERRYGGSYDLLTTVSDGMQILVAVYLWARTSGRWSWSIAVSGRHISPSPPAVMF
jgi:hypothetical protein